MALDLGACCTVDFCEGQLGSAGVRTRLRVATTLGLRDEPLSAILALRRFDNAAGPIVEWVQLPKDMHAVTAMLNAGLVDVAALYSEEAMEVCCSNTALRACGAFSTLPRRWCLLLPRGTAEEPLNIENCKVAIPEGTSARLAFELVREELEREGDAGGVLSGSSVQEASTADLVEYDSLSFALRALRKKRDIDAVLWEITILEKAVLRDWCDVRHELILPWPTHLFVASKETLFAKLCTVRYFMIALNRLLQDFVGELFNCGPESQASTYLNETHSLCTQEVCDWLEGQNKPWHSSNDIDESCIMGPLELISRLDLLPGVSGRRFSVHRFLSEGSNLIRKRSLSTEETDEADIGNCQEGAPCTPQVTREINLLPSLPRLRSIFEGKGLGSETASNARQLVGVDVRQRQAKEDGAKTRSHIEARTERGDSESSQQVKLPVPAG